MKKDKTTDFLWIAFVILQAVTLLALILFRLLKLDSDLLFGINGILQITLLGMSHCLQTYDYSQKNHEKLTGLVTEFSNYQFGRKTYYQLSVLTDDGRMFQIETSNFRAARYRHKKNVKIIIMPENVMPNAMLKEDLPGRGELFLFLFFPVFYFFIIPVIAYLVTGG